MNISAPLKESLETIRKKAPLFFPKVGMVLGSGLGSLANLFEPIHKISFSELPALRPCAVEGHLGVLHLSNLNAIQVVCFEGRNHIYEGHSADVIAAPVRLLKLLGAENLILISSVGSINPALQIGDLVMIRDHINFQWFNPLIGKNDPFWGERFPNLNHAYDPTFREQLRAIGNKMGIQLTEGVYMGVMGPNFETPAEIQAFGRLGADVVGMSMVAETIVARHCGIRVLGISVVTNQAAGLNDKPIIHTQALEMAKKSAQQLEMLLPLWIQMIQTTQVSTS